MSAARARVRVVRCPSCGNADPALIEDNGERPRSIHYALLCKAEVPFAEWAFRDSAGLDLADARSGPDGEALVVCGVQWSPNDE